MWNEEEEHEILDSGKLLTPFLASIEKELVKRGYSHRPKERLSWKKIVDEPLASHSYVKALEDGFLMISCKHPAHLQLLHIQKNLILQKLHRYYPSLKIVEIKGLVEHYE